MKFGSTQGELLDDRNITYSMDNLCKLSILHLSKLFDDKDNQNEKMTNQENED